MTYNHWHRDHRRPSRWVLHRTAEETLNAIRHGGFRSYDTFFDLHESHTIRETRYFPPEHQRLIEWPSPPNHIQHQPLQGPAHIAIHEISTLEGAFLFSNTLRNVSADRSRERIGVLNFASATKPGGGFRNGSQAQEESIARSSTLYASLISDESKKFYHLHKMQQDPFYTHAMIYSPDVEIFRDDDGRWLKPVVVDVLTSAAVNAEEVRQSACGRIDGRLIEESIELVMKERMARILCLFELQGARNLVLGSYGTGVFRNDVALVARLWAELLAVEGARFKNSFDRVIFAIVGRSTFDMFFDAFRRRCKEGNAGAPFTGSWWGAPYLSAKKLLAPYISLPRRSCKT